MSVCCFHACSNSSAIFRANPKTFVNKHMLETRSTDASNKLRSIRFEPHLLVQKHLRGTDWRGTWCRFLIVRKNARVRNCQTVVQHTVSCQVRKHHITVRRSRETWPLFSSEPFQQTLLEGILERRTDSRRQCWTSLA